VATIPLEFRESIGSKQCDFTSAEMVQEVYNKFPNCRYSGIYQFFTATLVIIDPKKIKQNTVKELDHLVDQRRFVTEDMDHL
jgi:hypothetical protein